MVLNEVFVSRYGWSSFGKPKPLLWSESALSAASALVCVAEELLPAEPALLDGTMEAMRHQRQLTRSALLAIAKELEDNA